METRVAPMLNLNTDTITEAVLARNTACPDPRLSQIMSSLVRHLHAFAREVKLTEDEWSRGIQFLTECGQITDDKRQEFILLSDTLGLSMLVVSMNENKPANCTEATVFGPFYVKDAPRYAYGADIANGAGGIPAFISGTIRSSEGMPIADAEIHVWQADEQGHYDVQYQGLENTQGRGVLYSQTDGRYLFKSIVPEDYPIPHDGPVGKLLDALGRHPWRPAHLHFMIKAKGYETLVTHVFRRNSKYLESDAVFGVRSSLIVDWLQHLSGTSPTGEVMEGPFYTLVFDFVLNPVR